MSNENSLLSQSLLSSNKVHKRETSQESADNYVNIKSSG